MKQDWYKYIVCRIPFTLYFIAIEKDGYLCLARKVFDGSKYVWQRI